MPKKMSGEEIEIHQALFTVFFSQIQLIQIRTEYKRLKFNNICIQQDIWLNIQLANYGRDSPDL